MSMLAQKPTVKVENAKQLDAGNILDKSKLKELSKDICGSRELLDDKVISVLAILVDQMVENVVDQSCMYAEHRGDDTLKKDDISFAVSQLFPDLSREKKVGDVQMLIDHQVNLNHAIANACGYSDSLAYPQGGTSISVGGQISTQNYKNKLLKVRKEQEQ
jgi:histone H3/H4